MNIVHISAELSPIAMVGGLAEAVFGLAHSSSNMENVSAILPYYRCIDKKKIGSLKKEKSITVSCKKKNFTVEVYKGTINGFEVILLKEDAFFGKKKIYGYKNDLFRFLLLSKAALQYLTLSKKNIDILHIHDWHTSACLPLYKEIFEDKGLKIKKSVLSIHNLCYQGICQKSDLEDFGIKKNLITLKNENAQNYSLLKGGILMADQVIAVSPTYAREILKKEHSCNLSKTLKSKKNQLIGLLNGIDTSIWNPKIDPFLPSHFEPKMALNKVILAKKNNKDFLFKKVGLENSEIPLMAFIGRLTEQKGLELIEHAIKKAREGAYAFILLGSSIEPTVQRHFEKLKNELKDYKNIHLHLDFNQELAHLIYASSDFMIVPSRFEPCGLVQLISFHYATIPIVRKTGGLKDTVVDQKYENGNGYVFNKYDEKDFDKALNKALANFGRKRHLSIMKNAFSQNYCWENSIKGYLDIYKHLTLTKKRSV